MKKYIVEFANLSVSEEWFADDCDAQNWVESILDHQGYDLDEIVASDWQAEPSSSMEDDEAQYEQMLFWGCEADAENDPGASALCSLSRKV